MITKSKVRLRLFAAILFTWSFAWSAYINKLTNTVNKQKIEREGEAEKEEKEEENLKAKHLHALNW